MALENNLAMTEEKRELREELDTLTKEYLDSGGTINQITTGATNLKGDKPLPFVKVS